MKIQTGDFGYRTPEGGGSSQVSPASFVVQGGQELAQAGMRIGHEVAQGEAQDAQLAYQEQQRHTIEAQAEAKQLAREAKRAEAMTIHAKAQNALGDAHDEILAGVANGTIKTDAAPKLWTDASTKIVDEHLKAVDKSNIELVRGGLVGDVGKLARNINAGVVKQNMHQIGGSLNDYIEEMGRLGVNDPETAKKQAVMAIESQGPLAGYNAEQVSKMKHSVVETITFNNVNATLTGIKDNARALNLFLKKLPEMVDLDPAKKNNLESKAMVALTRLEQKAIAGEHRRLTELSTTWTALNKQIESGQTVEPGALDAAMKASKGTQFEKYGQAVIDDQKFMAEWLKKPPAAMQAEVMAFDAKLRKEGGGPQDYASLQRMAKLTDATSKLLSNAPLQYSVERGGAQIEPLDIMKPESWGPNLESRAKVLKAQQGQVGGAGFAFFPQEAAAIANVLQSGTPEQKKGYLSAIRRGLNDDGVFTSTLRQIAKDSPETATAAMIAAKEVPLTTGRFFKDTFQPGDTASLILTGSHLINPTKTDKGQDGRSKGFQMPEGSEAKAMQQRFDDTVGEVFSGAPGPYNAALQTAQAYYAGATSKKNGGGSKELDSKIWADSIAATLPIVSFNGKSVLAPWGMDQGTFKDRVANAFPAALKDAGLPPDMAQATGRYTLQNVSGDSYAVRQGTEYLTGPKGKVIVKVPEVSGPMRDSSGRRIADQVPN